MASQPSTTASAEAVALLAKLESGEVTINELLGPLHDKGESATIPVPRSESKASRDVAPEYAMAPASDQVVQKTIDEIGPPHFPTLRDSYDVVAIGAGVAGLLSVIVGASLGKRCLLVEKHYLGGDCLCVGCFPSKALIACARRLHQVKTAAEFGVIVSSSDVRVDFPFVMDRMRKLRLRIAEESDGVKRYERDFCEHVVIGEATFVSPDALEIRDSRDDSPAGNNKPQVVRFDKCFICTGASASVAPVPGLKTTPHLTNGNLFNLETLPPRACLVGAGPIGIEMAQALARFGCEVTVFEIHSHLLPREDPDAAQIVADALVKDGVSIEYSVKLNKVEMLKEGSLYGGGGGGEKNDAWPEYEISATLSDGTEKKFKCEALLNATGRTPNVTGLNLDAGNVAYDSRSGVHVDEYLRSETNPNVYAAGDCCSAYKFTHAADFMARIAVRNAFLDAKSKHSDLLVPWCTYTDPEIAHVGKYEKELEDSGVPHDTYVRKLESIDRCMCEGVATGFVKISCAKDTDTMLGATIVGPDAGDLISEISVAMQNGLGMRRIAGVMHSYPTTAEAIRQCAAQFNKKLRTPVVEEVLKLRMAQVAAKRTTINGEK